MINIDIAQKNPASFADFYETGTFTMTLSFAGASVGIVYIQQTGFYTKIGNMVFCSGRFAISSKGTSIGDAFIDGLPFTVANAQGAIGAISTRSVDLTFDNMPNSAVCINSTQLQLAELSDAGVNSNLNNGNFTNDTIIDLSFFYRIA